MSIDDRSLASESGVQQEGDDSPARAKHTRRPRSERRAQIAEAVLDLVARYGVRDTSVHLIAEGVGVTPQALYAHFNSRDEMLVASLDCLYERLQSWKDVSSNPNLLERLREIMYDHMAAPAEGDGFVLPQFEFVAAPRDTDLPSRFGEVQLRLLEDFADMIKQAQEQGHVRKDIDPTSMAWRMQAWAWSHEIALLIGRDEYLTKGYSKSFIDSLIDSMAVPPA
jgi:AcrR family transcriptional regulator